MKLYVIRHGESETNRTKHWTGWLDVALTDRGEREAEELRPMLSNIKFDKIYSSDLTRAKKTAEIAIPGCVYEETPLIREVCLGNLEGTPIEGLSDDERISISKNGYADFGGETYEELMARAESFLSTVAELDCECVAAFSHGGFLRTVIDIAVGMRLPRSKVICNNCATVILEYKNGQWYLFGIINT